MKSRYLVLLRLLPVACFSAANFGAAPAAGEIPGGVMGTVHAHADSLDPPWLPRPGVLVLVEATPEDSLPPPEEVTLIVRDTRMEPERQVTLPGASLRIVSRSSTIQTIVAETETGKRLFSIALPMPGLEVVKRLDERGFVTLYPKNRERKSSASVLVMANWGSAVTDSAGAFLIPGIPPECRSIWAFDPQLGSVVDSVCVEPARATEIDLYLPPSFGTPRKSSAKAQDNRSNDIVD
jgi:hypothetical protein